LAGRVEFLSFRGESKEAREKHGRKKDPKTKKREKGGNLTVTSRYFLSSATLNAASASAIPRPSFWQGGSTLTWQTRRRVRSGNPYIENSVAIPAIAFLSPSSTASSMSQPPSPASIGEAASIYRVKREESRAWMARSLGPAVESLAR